MLSKAEACHHRFSGDSWPPLFIFKAPLGSSSNSLETCHTSRARGWCISFHAVEERRELWCPVCLVAFGGHQGMPVAPNGRQRAGYRRVRDDGSAK